MQDLKQQLTEILNGDVLNDTETLEKYSHDASMFELRPEVVVLPKNTEDIKKLIQFVAENKAKYPELSIVARGAGTCMSGGAIGESIVIDTSKYMNNLLNLYTTSATVQPGMLYKDFEAQTLKKGAIMPSFPASRDLCSVGGMVANNAGGEKSLVYGKTERFVKQLKVILRDGNEYTIKPLSKAELEKKKKLKSFEGEFYNQISSLIEKNWEEITSAKPTVSKDSTGYHLWNMWDPEKEVFDLTQLFTGSQGTLGIVTEITFKLVPAEKHSATLVIFQRSLKQLGSVINDVLEHKPSSFEGFDNYTLMLSFRLFFMFHQQLGWPKTIKLAFQLIPDAFRLLRGIPKMVLLVEFTGNDPDELAQKVHGLRRDLDKYKNDMLFEENETEEKGRKFWIMRRESFNLLRKKVKDKHTAPFMDDLVVRPEHLPEFLPQIRKIIKKYKLLATIAGHMGDGNFHIIPLMNIELEEERAKLEPAMREINKLVLKYNGSLSGEHNDGMIRGPWLEEMYGKEVFSLFKQAKQIFDPENIFNPHKKTDADWDFSTNHLRKNF